MTDPIDISGIPKHKVFRALFNSSKQHGLGFLDSSGASQMTESDAKEVCKREELSGLYFDYFRGRIMKVDLTKDTFFPGSYDRDNGDGAAQLAVDSVR